MPRYNRLRSEDTEQERVIAWSKVHAISHPELLLLYHVPNEGKRTASQAMRMARMGLKAGVPDLCLPVARGTYHGLYIEMKYDDGRLSPAQREWIQQLTAQGCYTAVCYGAAEAITVLEEYMEIAAGERMSLPSGFIWKDKKCLEMTANASAVKRGRSAVAKSAGSGKSTKRRKPSTTRSASKKRS